MIYKANDVDMIAVNGKTYEAAYGLVELPTAIEDAAAHGLVPASRADLEAAEAQKVAAEKAAAEAAADPDGKGGKDGGK